MLNRHPAGDVKEMGKYMSKNSEEISGQELQI